MPTFKYTAGKGISDQSVVVDGHDISKALRGFTLYADAGDVPRVELELVVIHGTALEAEDAQIYISQPTIDALVALGWTPPEES